MIPAIVQIGPSKSTTQQRLRRAQVCPKMPMKTHTRLYHRTRFDTDSRKSNRWGSAIKPALERHCFKFYLRRAFLQRYLNSTRKQAPYLIRPNGWKIKRLDRRADK